MLKMVHEGCISATQTRESTRDASGVNSPAHFTCPYPVRERLTIYWISVAKRASRRGKSVRAIYRHNSRLASIGSGAPGDGDASGAAGSTRRSAGGPVKGSGVGTWGAPVEASNVLERAWNSHLTDTDNKMVRRTTTLVVCPPWCGGSGLTSWYGELFSERCFHS